MATPTFEQPLNNVGTGMLNIAAVGTAQPLTDGVIDLNEGGSISAATIAFVAAVAPVGPTITDSGNGFVTAGFEEGKSIRVSGTVSNDGTYHVVKVSAGTLELDNQLDLTAEGAGGTFQLYEVVVPHSITLTALAANVGVLFVGGAGVDSTNGLELAAGNTITLLVNDLNKVFVDTATMNDDVSFLFVYNQ